VAQCDIAGRDGETALQPNRETQSKVRAVANGRNKYQSRENRAVVRQVLMESWDPIGVRDFPGAQDEYDGYVGKVYVMLMDDRASSQAIAAYLHDIAINYIGITPGPELKARSTHAGSLVVSLRASFETH
jgi:hypothetical protein